MTVTNKAGVCRVCDRNIFLVSGIFQDKLAGTSDEIGKFRREKYSCAQCRTIMVSLLSNYPKIYENKTSV